MITLPRNKRGLGGGGVVFFKQKIYVTLFTHYLEHDLQERGFSYTLGGKPFQQ